MVAVDSVVGTPAPAVDEEIQEKPWRKPGVCVPFSLIVRRISLTEQQYRCLHTSVLP